LISHPSDGWASLAPLAGDIRRAVEQGLTLYLHNVDARGLPFARRVLPEAGLKPVQSAPDEPVRIVRNGPLTWGISSQQLHWYDRAPTSGVRPLLPFPGLGFTAGVPHEAYVSDGRLLRVPLGEGWVVIDQVPWHDAPGNEEEARRYASILLTNLRVASGESPAPSAQ